MSRWLRSRRGWFAVVSFLFVLASWWVIYLWLADPWPAKLEFHAPLSLWPLGFTPDGRAFLMSDGVEITLWDCSTGEKRATWPTPYGIAVEGDFAPDGRTFAVLLRHDNLPAQVALIDVESGRTKATVLTHYDRSGGLRYEGDGSAIHLNSYDRTGLRELVTLDPVSATVVKVVDVKPQPGSLVTASPNGHYLAHFDLKGGPITLERTDLGPNQPPIRLIGLNSARTWGEFGFSDDDRLFAIGRLDGTVELWDIAQGRRVQVVQAHSGGWERGAGYVSMGFCFGPKGETLVSWGGYGDGPPGFANLLFGLTHQVLGNRPVTELVIVNLRQGIPLVRSTNTGYAYSSPNGRTLATRDRDGKIRLRDLPPR